MIKFYFIVIFGLASFSSVKCLRLGNHVLSSSVTDTNSKTSDERISRNPMVKFELLSVSDEHHLSMQYQVGLNIQETANHLNKMLGRSASDGEISSLLDISPDQMKTLVLKSQVAKDKFVAANMKLVCYIAGFYRFQGISYQDLVQEGTFGLFKAIQKFKPELGFRFSTYASWWIRQSICKAIVSKSRLVRLPANMHLLLHELSRIERIFLSSQGMKPTNQDIADSLKISIQSVETLQRYRHDISSIDAEIIRDGEIYFSPMNHRIPSTNVNPLEIADEYAMKKEMWHSLGNLTLQEINVLDMRFGLSQEQPMNLAQIGRAFNVTRERIRQVEKFALLKLRRLHEENNVGVTFAVDIFEPSSIVADSEDLLSMHRLSVSSQDADHACAPRLERLKENMNAIVDTIKDFCNVHGEFPKSGGTREDGNEQRLARFVAKQRTLHKKGSLPPYRVALMESIPGFQWCCTVPFEENVAYIRAFYDRFEDLPRQAGQRLQTHEQRLAAFISKQRHEHKRGILSPRRTALMETIESFTW